MRFDVSREQAGQRLDAFVRTQLPGHSRAAVAELCARGEVRVNGARGRKGDVLAQGDSVELSDAVLAAAGRAGAAPEGAQALRVLHEDAWLIAVDKPAGMPSHALRPGERDTAASWLLARYPELRDVGYSPLEPGLLHRLDTDTSGVLLAARTAEAFTALCALHEAGGITKTYLALCAGEVAAPSVQHAFLDAKSRKRVRVSAEPALGGHEKPITTELAHTVSHGGGAFSLVTVRVALAARHQIRAHLAALGHPIAGDALYGGPALPQLTRHFLHAASVTLVHPATGRELTIEAALPEELARCLARM